MSSCERKVSESCESALIPQDPRDWEENSLLKQNYNLNLEELKERLLEKGVCGDVSLDDTVYVYIVRTTRVNYCWCSNSHVITQWGCAPNFEGGIITLTNCKHDMRCSSNLKSCFNSGKLWIAGITTKDENRNPLQKNFLFYLMKVDNYYKIIDSFYDIWDIFGQVSKIRDKKDACNNPLGDLYRPKSDCNFDVGNDKWNPNCYNSPSRNHVHSSTWKNDITYACKNGNRPLLLIGENPFIGKRKGRKCFNSYLWTVPKIEFTLDDIRQGYRKMSLKDFILYLK